MLSNTAVPKYYGEFREQVWNGDIPISKEMAMEMDRMDDRIADPTIWYDPKPTEGWIKFCEGEMTLTNGDDLNMLPTFKLWGEAIFAFYVFRDKQVFEKYNDGLRKGGHWVTRTIKKRLINKQYLIVGRGAAKSLYETLIQAYFLICDGSTTQQITTSATMKQAEEVMQPLRTAIMRARGPVFDLLTEGSLQNTTGNRAMRQKLAPTKKGIENFLTNSYVEVRPMTIDKLQGLRSKVNTVDEWLSGEVREDVIGALEQGASKIPDWLIVAASSEGTVRNGIGDTMKLELMSILQGEYYAPMTSIFWYKLDSVEEVGMPEMWEKAQPNIDKTVTYDTYQDEVLRAEQVPSQRNDILAKRFGLPMEGYTLFFTYEETLRARRKQTFKGMPCALGADLSQGDDFCAFTFLFPLARGYFGVKTRSYITDMTYRKLSPAMHNKYREFIEEGSLVIMEGDLLDMDQVYDDLDAHIIEKQYDTRAMGYDPYNSDRFVARYSALNGPFFIEKVIQGRRTETVPLGEIKKLATERKFYFDQEIMKFAMGNCIVLEDTNGQRMLVKRHREEKIDQVSALMNAFIAWKKFKEQFE